MGAGAAGLHGLVVGCDDRPTKTSAGAGAEGVALGVSVDFANRTAERPAWIEGGSDRGEEHDPTGGSTLVGKRERKSNVRVLAPLRRDEQRPCKPARLGAAAAKDCRQEDRAAEAGEKTCGAHLSLTLPRQSAPDTPPMGDSRSRTPYRAPWAGGWQPVLCPPRCGVCAPPPSRLA